MDLAVSEFIRGRNALVVEDDAAIAQLLKIHLSQLGFQVDVSHNSESAFLLMQNKKFDLCLLDWMLPGVQGVDLLKKIRPQYPHLKLMMVTAKADSDSIVMGLESGADDYLTKPFDAKVLLARVRHLMRRLKNEENFANKNQPSTNKNAGEQINEITYDGLNINFAKHEVKNQNEPVHLTLSEFKLLEALYKAQGRVLTREQLINHIQGEDVTVTGRTIDTHIFALRKKIGAWSKYIETIRGVGYRILISADDSSEEVM